MVFFVALGQGDAHLTTKIFAREPFVASDGNVLLAAGWKLSDVIIVFTCLNTRHHY